MTRRESREAAFRIVFGAAINLADADESLILAKEAKDPKTDGFSENLVRTVYNHRQEIDERFKPFLKSWSIERISKIALAVLRISCAQLFYWSEITGQDEELSERIVINEAVELAKQYGTDEDYSFVNGVLGSIVRSNV